LRRAFAARNVVFAVEDGVLLSVIINDTDEVWRGGLGLRQDLDGRVLAVTAVEVSVEPRTTAQIVLPPEISTPEDPTAEVVVARLDTLTRVHTFVEDIELALHANPVDVAVTQTDDGYAIELTACSGRHVAS
jgi:beta-mannosidase